MTSQHTDSGVSIPPPFAVVFVMGMAELIVLAIAIYAWDVVTR
jgi:hypothetical protein